MSLSQAEIKYFYDSTVFGSSFAGFNDADDGWGLVVAIFSVAEAGAALVNKSSAKFGMAASSASLAYNLGVARVEYKENNKVKLETLLKVESDVAAIIASIAGVYSDKHPVAKMIAYVAAGTSLWLAIQSFDVEGSEVPKGFQDDIHDLLILAMDHWDSFDSQESVAEPISEFVALATSLDDPNVNFSLGALNPEITELFSSAASYIDPLVLDLDGDGIETLPANGTALFDHDADGVKEATGWIGPDDGLVTIDLNGNGVIDSGRELFGDNTILSNGDQAEHGFAALSEYDSNGDGIVDNQDEQYPHILVWRDLNSDGISQAGELTSLEEAGVASIATSASPRNRHLGNENFAAYEGSYTDTDGAEHDAASMNFAFNGFYREFGAEVDIPEELQGLPNIKGTGAVRDLQQAAVLNPDLAMVLQQYAVAQTKAEQLSLLDTLIIAWVKSSDFPLLNVRVSAMLTNDVSGGTYGAVYSGGFEDGFINSQIDKLLVLEVFNNTTFSSRDIRTLSDLTNADGELNLAPEQIVMLDEGYEALRDSLYKGLLGQTRLKEYVGSIALNIDGSGEPFIDLSGVSAALQALGSDSVLRFMDDLLDLRSLGMPMDDLEHGWDAYQLISDVAGTSASDPAIAELLNAERIQILAAATVDTTLTSEGIAFGNSLSNTLTGSRMDDRLYGGAGDDVLSAEDGEDTLLGQEGNDTLTTRYGNSWLDGGAGNDILTVKQFGRLEQVNYQHTLIGGKGNDTLVGYTSADTYLFRKRSTNPILNSLQ